MGARERLRHYYSVRDGGRKAGYLVARSIGLDVDTGSPDDVLWEAHREGMEGLRLAEGALADPRGRTTLLDVKLELARRILGSCRLCERSCGVDRSSGERGVCGVGEPRISSEFLHLGEESELIPSHTFFFSGCTFKCVFCQNHDISQDPGEGVYMTPEDVANTIGSGKGVNVNWVGGDPNPDLHFILLVMNVLTVNTPQVWNSNMYAGMTTMSLLDGVIDLYLTDLKYGNDDCGERLSKVKDYFKVVCRNHVEANRQCEMIVRHLVLPNHFECCTRPALDWIAGNLDLSRVRVNVMAQYRPMYQVPGNKDHKDIWKPMSEGEFLRAYRYAEKLGLDMC